MQNFFYGWYFKCQGDGYTLAFIPAIHWYNGMCSASLQVVKYDIMGPFVWVPFMEWHSVYSVQHAVNGTVWINGETYVFQNAHGYWEGDKGRSFPKEYLWTQCCFTRDVSDNT